MRRRLFLLSLALSAGLALAQTTPQAPKRPKLLLTIVIDQFRYDYLTRFEADYTAGIGEMLRRGAIFTNAHFEHFPTVTAIGHATVLTGATPSISGIVGNEWYDRETRKNVTSVSDDKTELIGGVAGRRGSSPHRLLVSTVADELKLANGRKSKAIGISAKDRGAVLPVGRMADAAYWFDPESGNFVTSNYYVKELPQWASAFNAARPGDKYFGYEWKYEGRVVRRLDTQPSRRYYDFLERTPIGNDLIGLFAEAAIENEKLGQGEATDVLSVSFSAHDRIGHGVGPHAPEMRDLSIQTDKIIGRLLEHAYTKVGKDNVLVVLTADHGVAPMPEFMRQNRMPGGRMTEVSVHGIVQQALAAKYGDGQWVVGYSGPAPYLNYDIMRQKKLNPEEVQNVAAEALRAAPHIFRVYTRAQLMSGRLLEDLVDRRVRNGFHMERSSDLFVVAQPYWLFEAAGTSHGTPFNYDSHVPVILMGPGVKPGRYHAKTAVNDIAPTVSVLLGVGPPAGSSGRVLDEALQQ